MAPVTTQTVTRVRAICWALYCCLAVFTGFKYLDGAHLFAKDKPAVEWRTGMLVDSTLERGSRGENLRNDHNYYEIDDGQKYVYVVSRSMTMRRDKPLLLTVNAPIKFALDGDDHMLLLDEKGQQHRLLIQKKALRK